MVSQRAFAKALLNPDLLPPEGLRLGTRPAGKRFSVYRNNFVVGLCDALATGFPVLAKLLGEEFFRAMAAEFVRRHPPASPVLLHYGTKMPEFLADFPPVSRYPYLPDTARLELALRASYHAADAVPIRADALSGMTAQDIEAARLELSPAVFQVRSAYPVLSIWRANMRGGRITASAGEDILIVRRGFDPEPLEHSPGGYTFIKAVLDGKSMAKASGAAAGACPAFDLGALISQLLSYGAVVNLH